MHVEFAKNIKSRLCKIFKLNYQSTELIIKIILLNKTIKNINNGKKSVNFFQKNKDNLT